MTMVAMLFLSLLATRPRRPQLKSCLTRQHVQVAGRKQVYANVLIIKHRRPCVHDMVRLLPVYGGAWFAP